MSDRLISADELLSLYEGEDENLRISLRVAKENIKDMPTIEINLQELEDRFGKYVRFVVEDMMSGEGKRWKNEL